MRYVAFLRAVNLGRRTVAMGRAREVLEGLGYDEVGSFVNSGNLLFSTTRRKAETLERDIRAALEDEFGFEITTFVRSDAQLRDVVDAQPFAPLAAGHTHFGLLSLRPLTAAEKAAVEAMSNEQDEVQVHGRDVHWLIRAKSTETSLGPGKWKKALPDNPTTARNMTMLARLAQKL